MKQAVCALIYNDEGKVLSVSRKDDHNDIGLPGGKVDEGDLSLENALAREVMEETGHIIVVKEKLFAEQDGLYWVTTFACEIVGKTKIAIHEKETGVVKFVTVDEMIKSKTFGHYNKNLFEKL